MPNENTINFNHGKDRITEAEVVPDFFERLLINNNNIRINDVQLTNNSNNSIKAINLLSTSLLLLPQEVIKNIKDIKIIIFNVANEAKSPQFTISASATILAIISNKTKNDLINLFTQDGDINNGIKTMKMNTDDIYINNDTFIVFYKE